MSNSKKLKSIVITALSLALLTACGTPTGNITGPDGSNTGNVVKTPIGNLTFSKVSDQNKALFDSNIAQQSNSSQNPDRGMAENDSGTTAGVAAPMPPMAGGGGYASDIAIAPGSEKMASPLSYFPMPGFFEEYVVTDTEEAKSGGFTGTFLDTLDEVVKPLITGLGSDSRLVSSSGSTDKEGLNKPVNQPVEPAERPGYYHSPYQWQYTFVSSANKEVYSIFVSDKETLVIRQKWGLRNLDLNSVKTDSNTAIKTVTDAIMDRNFKSPEGEQYHYNNPNEKREILYEIPEKGTWYFYLNQENGTLVWNVSLNVYEAYTMPAVDPAVMKDMDSSGSGSADSSGSSETVTTQTVTNSWVSGGYARIDADTGKILSLVRPMRYTYTYENRVIMPTSSPIPTPDEKPIPVEPDNGING